MARYWLLASAAVCFLAGCQWKAAPSPGVFPAERGVFHHEVNARGTVFAASGAEVRCEVGGQSPEGTMILEIVPEGTRVEKGDLLVELDSSAFKEERLQEQLQCSRLRAEVAEAENELEKVRLSFQEYLEGIAPEHKQASEHSIFSAQGALERAERELESAKKNPKRGDGTVEDLEARQFDVELARRELERAKASLESFEKFTKKRRLKELEGELASAEAKVRAKRQEEEIHAGLLERIEQQIAGCTITAPSPGVVFYADPQRGSHDDGSVIAEGSFVRRRQAILRLSRLEELSVRMEVREADMPLLRKGMPAEVYLDGAPGQMLAGEVAAIHPYPTRATRDSDSNKRYDVVVAISRPTSEIRPGVTAEVSVPIAALNDVVQVPASAVYAVNGGNCCLVFRGGRWQPRSVKIGPSNGSMTVIREGIEAGEEVAIHPAVFQSKKP